jgi:hypothetical protein
VVLFTVSIPTAILYATGYRFDNGFSLVKTGGVYISVPVSGASISLNGDQIGESSLFNRGFYIDNLAPGSYAIHVALPEAYPWYKTLVVEPHIVTDARAFLVSEKLAPVRLLIATSTPVTSQGTTTDFKAISRLEYDVLLKEFLPATTTPALSSVEPGPLDTRGGMALGVHEGNVEVSWIRGTSTLPSNFCIRPSSCVHRIEVEDGHEEAVNARFFGEGVLYQTKEKGISLVEIDVRPTALTIPVYPRHGAEFRIINGVIIVKDGSVLYEIVGW